MKTRQLVSLLSMLALSLAGVALLARTGVASRTAYLDAAAIFGAAFASSVAGFAFSAICGALLFRGGATPQHVVQIMLMSSIAIQSLSVVALWRAIDWRSLRTLLCGGACGLPLGVFLLYHIAVATYMPSGIGLTGVLA